MDDLTNDCSDESSEHPPEYPSARSFRGVEIVDVRGNPLGEFDEIVGDTLIEEKSALGVGQLHPRTGQPGQTVVQWAEKQIFQKTVVRLYNLQRRDVVARIDLLVQALQGLCGEPQAEVYIG